jgi:GT2 family glycosyltransferase
MGTVDRQHRSEEKGAVVACANAEDAKFAITIPCYKGESTIAETLEGILQQEEDVLARVKCVVIADDVSPDKTLDVVRRVWTREWPPLKFEVRRKNLGEMLNVNTTVWGLPEGVEWFLHMHGDNIPKPGWLRLITDQCLAADPKVGIVCASYDVFFEDGREVAGDERPGATPVLVKGDLENLRGTIRRGCWWHNSCGAIRVSTFREVGGLPPGMRQKGDWDFLLRVHNAGWDIVYLPRTLMRYRMHLASASSYAFNRHLDLEETLQIVQKYAPVLRASDIFRVHADCFFGLVRRCGASLYRREFPRLGRGSLMLVRTVSNCISCLVSG